jgi:bifunctional DNA-binding transcriptional regulator/antitoxin component of YhaV-PrlF toxin-antitoxin module
MTKKTLQPTNDLYIQFTDEEVQELGWEPGQRLEFKQHDDGSIELRPYTKIELDIDEWPREVLELIIKESCEKDISANDVINDILKQGLDFLAKNEELINCDISAAAIDPNFTNNDTSITNS